MGILVNLRGSIVSTHKVRLQSKRWHMRLIYHYLYLTIANRWLLYKRNAKYKNFLESVHSASADFRLKVAVAPFKMDN